MAEVKRQWTLSVPRQDTVRCWSHPTFMKTTGGFRSVLWNVCCQLGTPGNVMTYNLTVDSIPIRQIGNFQSQRHFKNKTTWNYLFVPGRLSLSRLVIVNISDVHHLSLHTKLSFYFIFQLSRSLFYRYAFILSNSEVALNFLPIVILHLFLSQSLISILLVEIVSFSIHLL